MSEQNSDDEMQDARLPADQKIEIVIGGAQDRDNKGEVLPAGARGRAFVKGASGNPAGRPRGSLNRSTQMAQAALADNMDLLMETALTEAIEKKNPAMLKFLLSRAIPAARENPMSLSIPEVTSPSELSDAKHLIVRAVLKGEISPSEAAGLAKLIEVEHRTHEWAKKYS